MSAPFFIISSREEEVFAQGTLFWDNYFQSPSKTSSIANSDTLNEIPWSIFRENLSKFFNDRTGTKKPLTRENLNYLGQKLAKKRDLHQDFLITREMLFTTENDSTLKFWGWFYSAVELTRKYLRNFWDSG